MVENYRMKDDCTREERYLMNLCEKTNIKPANVADALYDSLVQDRKDKACLQGKYENLYRADRHATAQGGQRCKHSSHQFPTNTTKPAQM